MIVRKLTLERVDQLQELIKKEKEEFEQFKQNIELLRNESVDDPKLHALYAQMLKMQEQDTASHEKHQQWLQQRQEKYAALTVHKQKLAPIRSKQDQTASTSANTSVSSSSVTSAANPRGSTAIDTSEDTATATSDSNSADGLTTETDKQPQTSNVTTIKSAELTSDMLVTANTSIATTPNEEQHTIAKSNPVTQLSSATTSALASTTNEEKSNVENAERPESKVSDSSPSVLSTLLQNPAHKTLNSTTNALSTIANDKETTLPELVVSGDSNNAETSKDLLKENNMNYEISLKPDVIKMNKNTDDDSVVQKAMELVSDGDGKEDFLPSESSISIEPTQVDDKFDNDDIVSESVETRHGDSTNVSLQEKEIKKEMLDNTNSNDSLPVKTSADECQVESRSESRRKRISSATSAQHAPTRRSGRFKSLRPGAEDSGGESRTRSIGSPQVASNSDSDQNQTMLGTQENSNASFADQVNSNLSTTCPSTLGASITMEERKGVIGHQEETNDSISSDTEMNTGRSGGPPSRPLSISESIPNSPASAFTDDPEQLKEYKAWRKSILLLWRQAATHKYSSLFTYPVTDEEAKGYSTVVYRPIDLTTIRKRIDNGTIRSTVDFQHDMMLLFQNAIMYNNVRHEVHQMAVEMQKEILDSIDDFIETQASSGVSICGGSSFNHAVMLSQSSEPSVVSVGNTFSATAAASPSASSAHPPLTTPQPPFSNEPKTRVSIV